jgi:hypothetical protein
MIRERVKSLAEVGPQLVGHVVFGERGSLHLLAR